MASWCEANAAHHQAPQIKDHNSLGRVMAKGPHYEVKDQVLLNPCTGMEMKPQTKGATELPD